MKIQYTDSNAKFNALLKDVQQYEIVLDSRKVNENDIFVSLPILANDDKDKLENQQLAYMKAAAKNQAKYIVCETAIAKKFILIFPIAQALIIEVDNIRQALGELASAKYNTSSHTFPVIGVTGTNGKTTLAFLLNFFLSQQKKKIAMLGTVEYSYPNFSMPSPLTTPDCVFLHSFFNDARKASVDYAIMEVSSHALQQERVAGLDYDTAIFTNLTQDHLDYHNTMEDYFEAKAKLFARANIQIINADDMYGQKLLATYPNAIAYTLQKDIQLAHKTLYGEILSSSPKGLELKLNFENKEYILKSLLIGQHNALNILALVAFGLSQGYSFEDFSCLEHFTGVSGRLERVLNSQNIHAFVDYAHTPDALVNVLQALRNAGFEKIVTVFGCGGDRDRTKRIPMAQAVSSLSDVAVLTSDNPRTENPNQILDDTQKGLDTTKEYYRFIDRKEAIVFAFNYIKNLDNKDNAVLLIAGKGHEDYQIIGTEKFPFSDQEIVKGL